jgi:hypothetical protein
MSLTSLSIILTVIVLQFHYIGSYAPEISENFYNFFTRRIAPWIGMLNKVKIYESKQLLNSKKSESISQLETSLTECDNNVNSIKKDLVLLSSDQVHSSAKSYAKNFYKKRETGNYIKIQAEKNRDYGVKLKINHQAKNDQNFYQVNETTNILNKIKKRESFRMEDCFKKIEMFSLNIQRYISLHEHQEMDINIRNKWKLIAEIIDRFIFWIFLIITFLSTIMFLLILPYLKNNYFSKSLHLQKNK